MSRTTGRISSSTLSRRGVRNLLSFQEVHFSISAFATRSTASIQMKTSELGLSTPRDFLRYRSVLLSAPTDLRQSERAVRPAIECQPLQCLCGYDAQLHLFAAALCRVGLKPWFLPAPDIYASAYSFAHLLNTLGVELEGPTSMLHISFGMAWSARILRGATNLAVLVGGANNISPYFGGHPFGAGTRFPAAFQGVLAYNQLQAPVCTPDGRELPTCIIDEVFGEEPISGPNSEGALDQGNDARLSLEFGIQSVMEFSAEVWDRLIRHKIALPGQSNPLPLILIPWNLANARSMVPDIALRLSSDQERGEYECGIILLPFNEDNVGIAQIDALVHACRARATPGCAETIFLMRVASLQSIPALRAIVTNCWLDSSDPEWQWNAKRLSRMGFKNLLLLEPGMEKSVEESPLRPAIDAVFPAEASRAIHSNNQFGEPFLGGYTVSIRGMRRLLQYTTAPERSPGDR